MSGPGHLLRDIHGLDSAPWWPPAPGWWLVLAAVLVGLALLWPLLRYWLAQRRRWERRAAVRLQALRRELDHDDPKAIAGELSELLRIVAVARFGRRRCAGLTGPTWLDWLAQNDPQEFDWRERGQLLLRLPYAPVASAEQRDRLRPLVDAVQPWLEVSRPEPTGLGAQGGRLQVVMEAVQPWFQAWRARPKNTPGEAQG